MNLLTEEARETGQATAFAEKTGPPAFAVLGTRVDRLDLEETLTYVRQALKSKLPHHVVTTNTLMLLEAQKDDALRQIIARAFLSVPESWGVRWAAWRHGVVLSEMIPGIDLMAELCRLAAQEGHAIYLLGSRPGIAHEAAVELLHCYPGLDVVETRDGFCKDDAEIIRRVRRAAPALLFVGMGMPQQEKWIARNLTALGVPIVMGVGGSFDVWAGRLARAPRWIRQLGLEWMFRLAQEPWRWRRILQLPVFMWKVRKENARGARQKAEPNGVSL